MSRNEKIYFKRTASQFSSQGSNQYLDVFDAIDKQTEYDEKALLRKFAKRDFARQFSVIKKYLFDAIMDTLEILEKAKKNDLEIISLKSKGEILIERGLVKEGLASLQKGQEKALYWELLPLYLDLLICETKHIVNNKTRTKEEIAICYQKMRETMQQLEDEMAYQELLETFGYWKKRERSLHNPEAMSAIESLMDAPLLQQLPSNCSFISKIRYYYLKGQFAALRGDKKKQVEIMAKNLETYDQVPHMQTQNELAHFGSWVNYLNILTKLEELDTKLFKRELKRFGVLSYKNAFVANLYFSRYNMFRLSYIELTGDYEDFEATMLEIEAEFKTPKYNLFTTEWRLLFIHVVELYIVCGDYKTAQQWCVELINLPKTDEQNDLQRLAELLQLIIHYKLGHDNLLEYLNVAAKRNMVKKNNLFNYEKLVLELIHKLRQTPVYEQKEILKHYNEECNELRLLSPAVFDYFNIQLWIESEWKRTTMAALLQKK